MKKEKDEFNAWQIIGVVAVIIFLGLIFNIPASHAPDEPNCYPMDPNC